MARRTLFHLVRSQANLLKSTNFHSGGHLASFGTRSLVSGTKPDPSCVTHLAAIRKRWLSQSATAQDDNKISIGPRKGGEGGNDEKDGGVVYYGPISNTIKNVKLLSLSTCCLSVSLGPVITFMTSTDSNVILKGAVASTVIFFSASTTAALHWFVSPYIHKLRWKPGSDSFEVEMMSWLATFMPKTIKFADIKHPDTNRPYVTFKANGNFYFVDAEHCPNKALLARRSFGIIYSFSVPFMAPQVDEKYREEINKARIELGNLVKSKEFSAPDFLRLAYASQFTIANSHHNDDAANATSTHDATKKKTQSANNNSLNTIDKIKANHPIITYPDLYQLAGIVAVKELGGIDIEFVPGRTESLILPDENCLPDVKQSPEELRNVFRKVKISDPKHIVALYGGLKLATAGAQATNLKLDNSYFVDLLDKKKNLSPAEKALLDDPEFHHCVQCYATHKEDFFEDYEEAHKKLADLGLPYSAFIKSTLEKSASQVKKVLAAQKAVGVGVAVAAAVVILSFFYVINRRTAKHSSYQYQ